MSFADDFSDDSTVDSHLEHEQISSMRDGNNLWSEIADKFRCLIINFKCSAVVGFLRSLLTFIRKGQRDSREFSRQTWKYLFAIRDLASKETMDESYYEHIRKVLLLHCVLELRLVSCFDDDSMVASDIFFKIKLLTNNSTSITVLDVLVDIDEQIEGSRSMSIMKIAYRHYLTNTLIGGPRVLDDNTFVKHLILFRSWYNEEITIEKLNVYTVFISTIKASPELRSNQSYALLNIDGSSEIDDYKKLLQHPLPQKDLVRALREAEYKNYGRDHEKITLPDLKMNDGEPVVKADVDLSLNLPNETIIVDDDIDITNISYMPKYFERIDNVDWWDSRRVAQQNSMSESVDLVSSDSDTENTETAQSSGMHRTTHDESIPFKHIATKNRSILRTGSTNTTQLDKKVTFKNPMVKIRVFERCDNDDTCSNFDPSEFIVTDPQYGSNSTLTTNISSSLTEIDKNECRKVKSRKSGKKKRSCFSSVSRTSLDYWIRRKKLTNSVPKLKKFHIYLSRVDAPLTGQTIDDNATARNEMHWDSNDDMPLINIIEVEAHSDQQSNRHVQSTKSVVSRKAIRASKMSSSTGVKTTNIIEPSVGKIPTKRKALLEIQSELTNCGISLKRLRGNLSTSLNDSSGSFMKASVSQKSSTLQSNMSEKLITNRSIEQILDSTSTSPQSAVTFEASNEYQSISTNQRGDEIIQYEKISAVDNSQCLVSIRCNLKQEREETISI